MNLLRSSGMRKSDQLKQSAHSTPMDSATPAIQPFEIKQKQKPLIHLIRTTPGSISVASQAKPMNQPKAPMEPIHPFKSHAKHIVALMILEQARKHADDKCQIQRHWISRGIIVRDSLAPGNNCAVD